MQEIQELQRSRRTKYKFAKCLRSFCKIMTIVSCIISIVLIHDGSLDHEEYSTNNLTYVIASKIVILILETANLLLACRRMYLKKNHFSADALAENSSVRFYLTFMEFLIVFISGVPDVIFLTKLNQKDKEITTLTRLVNSSMAIILLSVLFNFCITVIIEKSPVQRFVLSFQSRIGNDSSREYAELPPEPEPEPAPQPQPEPEPEQEPEPGQNIELDPSIYQGASSSVCRPEENPSNRRGSQIACPVGDVEESDISSCKETVSEISTDAQSCARVKIMEEDSFKSGKSAAPGEESPKPEEISSASTFIRKTIGKKESDEGHLFEGSEKAKNKEVSDSGNVTESESEKQRHSELRASRPVSTESSSGYSDNLQNGHRRRSASIPLDSEGKTSHKSSNEDETSKIVTE